MVSFEHIGFLRNADTVTLNRKTLSDHKCKAWINIMLDGLRPQVASKLAHG